MNVKKGIHYAEGFVNIFHGNITDDAYGQHFTVGNFVSTQKFVQNTNLNKVFLFYFFILPHLATIWRRFPTPRRQSRLHHYFTMVVFRDTSPYTHAAVIYTGNSQTSKINKLETNNKQLYPVRRGEINVLGKIFKVTTKKKNNNK